MNEPISIKEEDLILIVCDNLNTIYGKTFLQKIIYVIKNELDLESFSYDAYFYGPYSKELSMDLTELIKRGVINEKIKILKNGAECYVYSLTKEGKEYAEKNIKKIDEALKKKIDTICFRFSNFTPTQLLKYVYEKYPKSAENSIFFDI